ncbi:MAG: hypothetical protein CM15mP122_5380 [Bacteroidota bacterium]|nr:MAG: hypothetical protein CM15mP122_5380 [Bacteroidota bacterium]
MIGLNPGVSTDAPGNILCLGQNVEIQVTGGVIQFLINNTGNPALPAEVSGNKFTTNKLNDGDRVISELLMQQDATRMLLKLSPVLSLSSTGSITPSKC